MIISSTKPDPITKTNHQNNSQPYAQCHQDVHQTKLLITTHNHHPHMPLQSMYTSQPSTNLYHNKCINHAPKTYSNITNKGILEIHHTIHKLNTINPYIKPCAKTSLIYSLKHVPLIIQSYTKTTNKCLSQCTTRYANKTKISAPTMCLNNLPQIILYNRYHTSKRAYTKPHQVMPQACSTTPLRYNIKT
jgi:hypothetical protein